MVRGCKKIMGNLGSGDLGTGACAKRMLDVWSTKKSGET